jgi:hypothetical protein
MDAMRRSVWLARYAPREFVRAEVVRDFPPSRLADVESEWGLARRDASLAWPRAEHAHWDWRDKMESVVEGSYHVIAVECEGKIQGLMAVSIGTRTCILSPTGRPILYVDYLETAPWNLRLPEREPRYTGVGRVLVGEAILQSLEYECGGRVGLHSLQQAEEFYQFACGMTLLGRDPDYHDLMYFEYTYEQADRYLKRMEK